MAEILTGTCEQCATWNDAVPVTRVVVVPPLCITLCLSCAGLDESDFAEAPPVRYREDANPYGYEPYGDEDATDSCKCDGAGCEVCGKMR